MASLRLVTLLFALAISVAFVLAASKPRAKSVIAGSRVNGDFLIQREFEKVPSKLLQTVKSQKTFTGDRKHRITQVKLLDQNKNGNGASASIINGGPGKNFVTVNFKSVQGHSIDYIVELYGR